MKLELEHDDIESIAKRVAELVGSQRVPHSPIEGERIFDVKGLGEYLKVESSWIYTQVKNNAIPYFKVGKYIRFRKSDIDKWIALKSVKALDPSNYVR